MLFTDLKPAEYERRLETIQRLMTEQKLDALFLCNEASFRYFTGHISLRWMNTLMPLSAVVPRKGKPSVMMSAAEVAIAEHNPAIGRGYAVTGDQRIGVPQMKQALLDLGVSAGRVGGEFDSNTRMLMPLHDFQALQSKLPSVEWVDASDLIWQLRQCKSSAELAYMRKAVKITDAGYAAIFATACPGMTERDIHDTMLATVMQLGADRPGFIPVGSRSPGDAHAFDIGQRIATDRIVQEGDLVQMDAGAVVHGYWSDFSRIFCVGRADERWQEEYRLLHTSLRDCIAACRPGLPIRELVVPHLKNLSDSPYAADAERFRNGGRIGHAIGLDLIEPPFLHLENNAVLQPGMVLTIEPSLIFGDDYMMIEEDVLITADGYEVLSQPSAPELPELR